MINGSYRDTNEFLCSKSTKVVDLESYIAAETSLSTKLWHEAFADAFSVGFLRMTEHQGSDQVVADQIMAADKTRLKTQIDD